MPGDSAAELEDRFAVHDIFPGQQLTRADFIHRHSARPTAHRIDHVTDGDTVVLRNGQKVRLVQIDTPEVYFGTECYGTQASATTKRLLPEGGSRSAPERSISACSRSVQPRRTSTRGVWGACPRTPYDPYRRIDTRR